MSISGFVNDGSMDPPKLKLYLNLDTLIDLRSDSIWREVDNASRDQRLLADGFEGVQLTADETPPADRLLSYCGIDRINSPADADMVAAKHADRGDLCVTVHAGWGLEDDDEVFRLVEAILLASDRRGLPIFLETHRATITQDLWRTVQITKRFPELRLNGDFSHYYCGQELVYGDWAAKLLFMEPIFARLGFIHGRVASPGCMQVSIDEDLESRPTQAHGVHNYLVHFEDLWTRAMMGFIRAARPGDILIFAPELLAGTHYYARMFPNGSGALVEESDRYAQALRYNQVAGICFAEAKRRLAI
jgi:hypothetical protein